MFCRSYIFLLCGIMLNFSFICAASGDQPVVNNEPVVAVNNIEAIDAVPKMSVEDLSARFAYLSDIIKLAQAKGLDVKIAVDVDEKSQYHVMLEIGQDHRTWEIARFFLKGTFIAASIVAVYLALPLLVQKCMQEPGEE